ncbi:hypothetical protein BN982_02582 [Halobacillus karajensis]|uniref:Uncharacterized protein n=1 Tax=Halobacillus karajensis TaxID=195088 RepID=A0A024P8A2_9BACI|nr:hypothetical protein BN982_02582 [Halobacillus karajensis]CDQ25078.1 hypothetical protein BN983_03383 [Halobacillus karajensis]CDQ28561.1 hypothetical protein BN981_02869 [Halobacillus karajensis]
MKKFSDHNYSELHLFNELNCLRTDTLTKLKLSLSTPMAPIQSLIKIVLGL